MGTMDLASFSRDGDWSHGEECRGQHLAQILTLIRERPDGTSPYFSWMCCRCGVGGKKKTLDGKSQKF